MAPRALAILGVALSQVAWQAAADRSSFDCPMRQMLMDYARQINPQLGTYHLSQLADALNGAPEKTPANCTVSTPASARVRSRFGTFALPAAGAVTVYADPVNGNDNGSGTQQSPFKTIQRALQAARASLPGSASIILRAGTFFVNETISIGANDSGLAIQSFPGEEVWLSRGTPLVGVTWTPFTPSPAPPTGWITQQNENAVFGEVPYPTVLYNGTYNTWQDCLAACQANYTAGGPCTVWTWHDANTGTYALQCYFRSDNVYQPTAEADHVSGYFVPPLNMYSADLSGVAGLTNVVGLRAATQRMVRARYPNANPELDFGSSLNANYWYPPNMPIEPAIEFNPQTPYRNDTTSFQTFQLGIGGICGQAGFGFEPPVGYWCGNGTSGGGAFTWRTPVGMIADTSVLPNQPYANPVGAVIQAWHPARWASRMYFLAPSQPSGYTWAASNTSGLFYFAGGGFQDARGSNDAGNFYVENVWEEFDAPSEWFYNTSTQTLYFFYNATSGTLPPSDGSVVAIDASASMIFNVTGTQASPVTKVSFLGIGFRDAAYTYDMPHGMPSGGDWALQRHAALFVEGAESVLVDGCVFERLDGNALGISGYNRYMTVQNSEFAWIGDSAIFSWGYTEGSPDGSDGWDATAGNIPMYNQIINNFAHELGIWEKQSSFYMQAKTFNSNISGNIFFNGPRAGINFNDGMGGGSNLTANIIFNTCRESGDHGPFNSWNRQVFVTAETGVNKAYDYLSRNFFISNYNAQEGIDNDDASAYYESQFNFLAYSGNGMKSDFSGHDNHHAFNVYAYIGRGFSIDSQLAGHEDKFYSNIVVQTSDGDYGNPTCSGSSATVVFNNTILSPTGAITECGMTLAQWQAQGNDPNTTAGVWPTDAWLLAQARNALGMPAA